jgi:enoyl-CoA hydratase/carnithine racemase
MSEVTVKDADRVRWITLNRPESKNGLTIEVNEQLIAALDGAGKEKEIRAVVLFGAGGAFCSGLDLKAAATQAVGGPADIETRMRKYFHGLIRAIRAISKPVIAVVDGAAAGYGCDLALACDVRVCSDRARFGEIFVKRGLMPDGGGTFHLPRIVGLGRALELMFTGDVVDAQEAYRIGLANRVVPTAEIEQVAHEYAKKIAAGPPLVHERVKQYVYAALEGTLEAALENEMRGQLKLLQSKDFFEGVSAFFQKRAPDFKGE